MWLDALVNYLTISNYPNELSHWPPDCHIIGKDIIKFHCIYWPAFLMAADLQLPRSFICHSHWTIEDLKMSKSRRNVIDPFQLLEHYSSEGIRYFLLRQAVPHSDTSKYKPFIITLSFLLMLLFVIKFTCFFSFLSLDFSFLQLKRFLNTEIADTLGNLLNRCASLQINQKQIYPATPNLKNTTDANILNIINLLSSVSHLCKSHYEDVNFYLGIEEIMKCLREANKYIEVSKPWKLVKDPQFEQDLNLVLYIAFETLRVTGILLQPIVPKLSTRLLDQLNVPTDERAWSNALPYIDSKAGKTLTKLNSFNSVLFTKIK